MIRPLRRAHLVIWSVLAAVLLVGFLAGLAARKAPAVMKQVPQELR